MPEVYISCDTNQEIVHFKMDASGDAPGAASGRLERRGSAALPPADGSGPTAITSPTALPSTGAPLTVNPAGTWLYGAVRTAPFRMAAYRIDPGTGELTFGGEAPLPASTPYVTTDRSGRFLIGAATLGKLAWVSRLEPDGSVSAEPHQVIEDIFHPHFILPSPDNRRVYIAATGEPEIRVYDFDDEAGTLSGLRTTPYPQSDGAFPRHLALHPNHAWLYAVNENTGTVDGFTVDAGTGALAHFQRVRPGGGLDGVEAMTGADIHITPDGRLLFSSERSLGTISVFAIDAATGRLSLLHTERAGSIPRSFGIDASGRYLVSAAQGATEISTFAIDSGSGRLEPLGNYEVGLRPIWVTIVER